MRLFHVARRNNKKAELPTQLDIRGGGGGYKCQVDAIITEIVRVSLDLIVFGFNAVTKKE